MLTINTSQSNRSCDTASRRSFLRVGSLGLAGLSLPHVLAMQAQARTGDFMTDKSVVFLYLAGGPSQIETFDPKMTAPSEVRSVTGEVRTCLPGITFGGTFPKLAEMADRLVVARSFMHSNTGHDGGTKLFGIDARGTALSPTYARLLGQINPKTGMLSSSFVSPLSAGFTPDQMRQYMSFFYKGIAPTGALPATFAPFHPTADKKRAKKNEGGLLADMNLNISLSKLENRKALLKKLDRLKISHDKANDQGNALSEFQLQAFDVLQRGVSEAFDLSKEDPRTLKRYDTSHFKTPSHLVKRQKNGKMSAQSQTAIGKQMLLARRLCEAGCRFITVGMNDWDHHGNENSYPIADGMQVMGGALDHAVSAFLEDVKERGLSDKILLVMTGEMGRTPRLSTVKSTGSIGRNHWGRLGALALAGGGLNTGRVIGRSDNHGGEPATEPVTPANLISTITHTLFDMGRLRLETGLPKDLVNAVSSAKPINELS